jgi:glutathione synthase/RimK-type ligase-like ATP-grasp enzyme
MPFVRLDGYPGGGILRAMHIQLATCRHLPDLTASDAVLRAALEARGATVTWAPWDLMRAEPGSLVCPRSTWDYYLHWPEFRDWIAAVAGRPGTMWNPPETLLWNGDKIYLRELQAAGVTLPHTRWFEPGDRPDRADLTLVCSGGKAVLKPRVSGTAYATFVVEPDTELPAPQWRPLEQWGSLLQAFVPGISNGEASLIFVAGSFSHAVLKRPAPGEFRVQNDHGGTVEPLVPTAELIAFAERALTAAERPWLYARVDVVETASGPLLMELELLEPDLFFTESPAGAGRLADALLAQRGTGPTS